MPESRTIGGAGPIGPVTRRSEFSRTDRQVGLRPGEQPRLIKPLPQAQTGAIDPYGVVQGKLDEAWGNYQRQYKAFETANLDVDVFNRLAVGARDEYDQTKGQLTGVQTQLNLIQQGVTAGDLTAEAGREAAIRMIVPRETADLMFPSTRAEPRGRFSPSEFNSYVAAFKDVAEPAIKRPWLGRNYADPTELKDQYFTARAQFAYDTDMNVDERRAFDLAWDQAMKGDSKTHTAWKKAMKEDPDLFTSRTYDSKLLELAADKARGTTSPLGKSVSRAKPTVRPALMGAMWAPSQFFNVRKPETETMTAPKRQVNQRTGQTRVSYDGGRTWQIE